MNANFCNSNEADLNPLMSDGKKKGHTYLNKPVAFTCRFV